MIFDSPPSPPAEVRKMAVKRVQPEEARELIEKQGYVYVDVRSVPEFAAGHPEGAYNVPIMHAGAGGMSPNADFITVMQKAFPRDAKLVVGCKAGGRSARAAAMLEAAGYTNVIDQTAGFDGGPDPASGRMIPGWRPAGLPVSQRAPAERTWDGLKGK
jgi:rhodanese-related sulfurtransferase